METALVVFATLITFWILMGLFTRWRFIRLGRQNNEPVSGDIKDVLVMVIFWPWFLAALIGLRFIERLFGGHTR